MLDHRSLIREALRAREYAYAPYSNFMVGAALLAKDGRIFGGCNVENAAFSPTNCAERTAFFKAISEGVWKFEAIAIVGGMRGAKLEEAGYAYPCGVCRQVMYEFCDPEKFHVIVAKGDAAYMVFRLEQLLPCGFGAGNM